MRTTRCHWCRFDGDFEGRFCSSHCEAAHARFRDALIEQCSPPGSLGTPVSPSSSKVPGGELSLLDDQHGHVFLVGLAILILLVLGWVAS